MVLKCLGSSSAGNCYILEASDGQRLVIEAGVKWSQIKKGLAYRLLGVQGCLVSHRHNDHAASIADVAKAGIKVLALEDVLVSHGIQRNHFAHAVEPLKGYKLGDYNVYTFDVRHDVPCLGFHIYHREMGNLLFATDTMMLEYRFEGLKAVNHWLVEANYADDILEDNIKSGYVNASMRERLLETHMELQTTKGILTSNDLSKTRQIVLIHLSMDNAEPWRFRDEIESSTGIPTHIASNGLLLDMDL